LVDENEERHMSWTYDCAGRATLSELGSGIEKVTVAYTDGADASATVTHYVGPAEKPVTSVSTFGKKYVQGIAKPTTIDAPCAECGTIAERSYDTIGNVTKTKDFNSNYSCFAYEATRNLETTRVEGVVGVDCIPMLGPQTLTLPARKTTTKWHAHFSVPEVIAEPKRITKYQYDASGNLTSQTEQATTDLTGSLGLAAPVTGIIRTSTYTYNDLGQLKTVTGPRTDIVDRTTYDYHPSTGDLIKITNAANQTTTFSDYDAHGLVHTIRAPNGVTTTFSYTPRGWVASMAVSNGTSTQKTSYDYTPSGQVKMVTLPDNSVTTYIYDVAQRLTSISNNRGDSITYTLDLAGNRIKEEVRDLNGNLARQITRTYDIIGRLTSQTGAAQ
jgi:YD repeat-containing protein